MAKYKYTLEDLNDGIRGVSNQVYWLNERVKFVAWVIIGLVGVCTIIIINVRG